MELEQQRFDLRAVVEDCASLFERKAMDHNIRLTVDVENNGENPVCGDPLRLSQVLGNLISNAVKFTRDGNVDIRIRHEAANPDYVLFEVADTGTGIDQTRANRLFEHFYQVDASTSRRHGGTGLGLAICRQLVELMGGEIGVESEPGKGSCFWFRIPLPAADQVDDQTPAPALADAEPINGSARLLVVDDNHINLMVAEGICKKLGHRVVTAESGMEAVAVLLSDSAGFDLVLMDCEMPEMDGFETTAEIHRLQAEGRVDAVPVIALTAHAIPEKVRACREAGMVSHIAKPINTARLGQAIRLALDGTADPRNDAPG